MRAWLEGEPSRGAEIGVVIVTYNSRAHMGACLDAVRGQGIAVDLVVVDNASADGTAAFVRERWPDLRVLENPENRGFAVAANQGARAVGGELLLLLNPDAVMQPGSLAALVRALQSDPAVGLCGPRLENPDGSPQPSAWMAPGLMTFAFDALLLRNLLPRSRFHFLAAEEVARDVDCLSGACLLVRRSLFEALDGFDESFFLYHEDMDFCLRARKAGVRARLVGAARVRHVLGGSAFRDRREFWWRFHESRRRLVRKHLRGPRCLALLALHELGLVVRVLACAAQGWLGRRQTWREEAGHHLAALRRLHARVGV